MMPVDTRAMQSRERMMTIGLFTILSCGIPLVGCGESDRVVATVNGVPIRASELESPAWLREKEKQVKPDIPKQEMDAWARETRRKRLHAKILEVLEKSEAEKLNVVVEPAEVDRMVAAFREFIASIKPGLMVEEFGRQSNARVEALNRLQKDPDKADEIYVEMLEPLGMDRAELDVSPEFLAQGPFVGHSPETEAGWRQSHEEQLLRQKRLATLFGVEFEVSEAEIAAHEQRISGGDEAATVSMRYMALGMVREDRINDARAAWLQTAVAEADIQIVDREFEGLSVQVERP